jgi:hypothetical protein
MGLRKSACLSLSPEQSSPQQDTLKTKEVWLFLTDWGYVYITTRLSYLLAKSVNVVSDWLSSDARSDCELWIVIVIVT